MKLWKVKFHRAGQTVRIYTHAASCRVTALEIALAKLAIDRINPATVSATCELLEKSSCSTYPAPRGSAHGVMPAA